MTLNVETETHKILVADDENSLCSAIAIMLRAAGYDVCEARDGLEALSVFERESPDLVVLDVMMPKLNGFDACGIIRKVSPDTPVIFLTACGDISDKTIGFHTGGNDYLTKPFDQRELLLRIESFLRRTSAAHSQENVIEVNGLHIDLYRRKVTVDGEWVALTPKEFDVLAVLACNIGRVVPKLEIIDEAWGSEYRDTAINVAYYIRHIREKIETDPADPQRLRTAGRMGYRLGS